MPFRHLSNCPYLKKWPHTHKSRVTSSITYSSSFNMVNQSGLITGHSPSRHCQSSPLNVDEVLREGPICYPEGGWWAQSTCPPPQGKGLQKTVFQSQNEKQAIRHSDPDFPIISLGVLSKSLTFLGLSLPICSMRVEYEYFIYQLHFQHDFFKNPLSIVFANLFFPQTCHWSFVLDSLLHALVPSTQ